jgi:hypothetical protein
MVAKFRNAICPPSTAVFLHRRAALPTKFKRNTLFTAEKSRKVVYNVRYCIYDYKLYSIFYSVHVVPNPHCFIAKPKNRLVAEKNHYYPIPCTALWGGGGRGVLPLRPSRFAK